MTDVAHLRALAFAARAAAGCSDVLGDALVSVILHGSLTLDAFMPGRSDIDLLVVVDGHAPEAVIGPVPDDWLIEIGDRQLAAWQDLTDDADHAELMVLTACRIWRFATERVHCSKTAAGRWALERDPTLGAVEEALRRRTSDPATAIGAEGIVHLLALVREELRRRRHSGPLRRRRQTMPARRHVPAHRVSEPGALAPALRQARAGMPARVVKPRQ